MTYLKLKGINITHEIIKGRVHRNMSVNKVQYKGVNELGDKIVEETFNNIQSIRTDNGR